LPTRTQPDIAGRREFTLDGSASYDPDGGPITSNGSGVGSKRALSAATSAKTTFRRRGAEL
jgi:hypothetical protein